MMQYQDDKAVNPPRKRILICGDRNYKDWIKVQDYLNTIPRTAIIIHGGARGADSLAGNLATSLKMKVIKFSAEWDKYGKAAGVLRNQQMLDDGHPDLVVYFHKDIENSKGTKDMVTRAVDNKIKTINGETGETYATIQS
jgi:hypothetical protein